mgnify:CR=1 FL=1
MCAQRWMFRHQEKRKIFIVAEDAALRDSFELTKEAYANLAGASEVMVQQDKTGIGRMQYLL